MSRVSRKPQVGKLSWEVTGEKRPLRETWKQKGRRTGSNQECGIMEAEDPRIMEGWVHGVKGCLQVK